MQGTYVEDIPRSEDSYTQNVLKSYHEHNLLTLQSIICECKGVYMDETIQIAPNSSFGNLS